MPPPPAFLFPIRHLSCFNLSNLTSNGNLILRFCCKTASRAAAGNQQKGGEHAGVLPPSGQTVERRGESGCLYEERKAMDIKSNGWLSLSTGPLEPQVKKKKKNSTERNTTVITRGAQIKAVAGGGDAASRLLSRTNPHPPL